MAKKTLKRTDKPSARDQSQEDNTGHKDDGFALSEPVDDFPDDLPHRQQFRRITPTTG